MRYNNIFISILLLVYVPVVFPQSIVNSVHNLSVTGPGVIKATSEQEICIFCHTPHSSRPDSPLWNRNDPGVFYSLYTSPTSQSATNQPSGSSILCLSCHDGTIALGNVLNRIAEIDFSGGVTQMPVGMSNLSSDLSDDHPVSFQYNSALAAADGQLVDPSLIAPPVSLNNGNLECTSCHDPHKNIYSDFLVVSPQFSELCFKCHDRNYWASSSHKNSTSVWNGSGTDPWFHTGFPTVAENACESCHNPHGAEGKPVLMNYIAEENNCLVCHNGNVAATDIESQLTKSYLHNVYDYNLTHSPSESALVTTMHVECEDCHNPHAVNSTSASAPAVSGSIAGTKGVTLGGSEINPVQYQYELCFRCHADSPGRPGSPTTRLIEQNNTRFEFDPGNPSYHPVAAIGKNTDSPSLIAPFYTESSIIYCTDCHSSDGSGSPAGPHGSNWPRILKLRYETADFTVESPENYALCYSCHSRTSILNDESFGEHKKHIEDEDTPCNACHDPHGINAVQGTSTNNTHLINFDATMVSGAGGSPRFIDEGVHTGYCMLRCHGRGHGIGMRY